jgi:hypothetical protein
MSNCNCITVFAVTQRFLVAQQQEEEEEQETDEAFYRKPLLYNRDKIFKQKLYYS